MHPEAKECAQTAQGHAITLRQDLATANTALREKTLALEKAEQVPNEDKSTAEAALAACKSNVESAWRQIYNQQWTIGYLESVTDNMTVEAGQLQTAVRQAVEKSLSSSCFYSRWWHQITEKVTGARAGIKGWSEAKYIEKQKKKQEAERLAAEKAQFARTEADEEAERARVAAEMAREKAARAHWTFCLVKAVFWEVVSAGLAVICAFWSFVGGRSNGILSRWSFLSSCGRAGLSFVSF